VALASETPVPFGPSFVFKCLTYAECLAAVFLFFHFDVIKGHVMLCFVMRCCYNTW